MEEKISIFFLKRGDKRRGGKRRTKNIRKIDLD